MAVLEERYLVLKWSDIERMKDITSYEFDVLHNFLCKYSNYRRSVHKDPLKCIVVEHDWPEYEQVKQMILK
jgi:ribosome biogenesis protein Nip4